MLVTLMQITIKPLKFSVAETGRDLNTQFTLNLTFHNFLTITAVQYLQLITVI